MVEPKRPGRPTTPGRQGEKATLGIRASAGLKTRLLNAADVADRSLSAEAEFGLESSFQTEAHLLEAQKRTYGPALVVSFEVIGRAINELNRHVGFPQSWIDKPHLVDEARWSADAVLGGIAGQLVEQPARIVVAPMIVWSLMAAVKDPEKGASDLREWARPLHDILGPEGTSRMRIGSTVWLRSTGQGIESGPGNSAEAEQPAGDDNQE